MAAEQPVFSQELLDVFSRLEAQIPPATNTNAVGEVLVNMVEELTVTGTDETDFTEIKGQENALENFFLMIGLEPKVRREVRSQRPPLANVPR